MAYEAINNLGHSGRRVIIVLNDNGRSYAPTVSSLTAPRPVEAPEPEPNPRLIERVGGWMAHAPHQHPPQPDVRAAPAAARGLPP